MKNKVKTNNQAAWNSLHGQNYLSGGSALPVWGIAGVGMEITPQILNLKNKKVLELGCGDGQSVAYIMKNNPKEYVGLDISEEALKQAKNNHKDNVFIQGDISKKLPFKDGSFDEVISVYGIGWSENIEQTICEIYRVLKPGGKITFSWDHYLARVVGEDNGKIYFQGSYNHEQPTVRFNWNQTGYNITSFQAKPSTWIQLFLKQGFQLNHFYELSPETNQQTNHSFSQTYSTSRGEKIPFTTLMQFTK